MKTIRATIRGILTIFYTIWHMLPGAVMYPLGLNYLPIALRWRQRWANRTLHMLGVRVARTGEVPAGGPYIFVGNHRSYLDPIAVLRDVQALPVAKAEVGAWPLIGVAAKVTGILYVKRESKRSRADTLGAMDKLLRRGYSVLVYPEGTTHTDPACMPFQRGAFSLAARGGYPVIPMAIEYLDLGDAWIGKDTFLPHFMRCFGKKRTHILLRYGPPLTSDDAKQLAAQTQRWVDEQIAEMRRTHDIRQATQVAG